MKRNHMWRFEVLSDNCTEQVTASTVNAIKHIYGGCRLFETVVVIVLSPIGTISALLCLFTVCDPTYRRAKNFFKMMVLMCVSELVYNLSHLIMQANMLRHGGVTVHNFTLIVGLTAMLKVSSNFSDLLFQLLSLERYLAVCTPVFWHLVRENTKQRLVVASILLSFVLSTAGLTECLVTYVGQVQINGTTLRLLVENSHISQSRWYLGYEVFAECVWSSISLAIMLFSVVSIVTAERRQRMLHHRQRGHLATVPRISPETPTLPIQPTPATNEACKFSITNLVMLTGATFVFDKITNLAACGNLFLKIRPNSIGCNDAAAAANKSNGEYPKAAYVAITIVVHELAEVLSHSSNFIVFLVMCYGFRKKFITKVNKIYGTVKKRVFMQNIVVTKLR
ncbi:unnamed protein product [Soboliphyme baturini]|uniref:G_PROTEIN_RECEP_F1_2 domain-containing protein n=1 Tax=Soboliphyme baturini TaxID=241478 RepID=A0A183INI5_9BILA|nr:unnamed protein product [Soboliphyme baturini]